MNESIAWDARLAPSKDVLFQEVSGEMVLLDLASENYFGLNEIGAKIWQALADGNTLSEAANILVAEYEVEREVVEADLKVLVQELTDAGLVSVV